MALLDSCDTVEHTDTLVSREEILAKIDKVNERIVELNILREEVLQNGTKYDTDTDARMMKVNNHGADICHNVQIAVDDKHHIVVAVDVTSQPVDKEQLYSISSQAKENMQVDEMTVIADKGYYSAKQFALCEKDGIFPVVYKAYRSFLAPTAAYSKESFRYDAVRECYICPEGQYLKSYRMRDTSRYRGYVKYLNAEACVKCDVKSLCASGKGGRTIQDRPLESYARIVDQRTRDNSDMYKQRKQLVEHPFGTIKRAWCFSYFLTRGTENVTTESILHFMAYNLKRAINTMGSKALKVALQG